MTSRTNFRDFYWMNHNSNSPESRYWAILHESWHAMPRILGNHENKCSLRIGSPCLLLTAKVRKKIQNRPFVIVISSMILHIILSLGLHGSAFCCSESRLSFDSIDSVFIDNLQSISDVSGSICKACCNISWTLSRCFWNLNAVSMRCRRWSSIITLRVSLAWWGLNSFSKWCMWMKSKLRSSTWKSRRKYHKLCQSL